MPRWWLTRFGATWSSISMPAAPVASISRIVRTMCTGSPNPTPPSTMSGSADRAVMRRAASASSESVRSASETASSYPSAPPDR